MTSNEWLKRLRALDQLIPDRVECPKCSSDCTLGRYSSSFCNNPSCGHWFCLLCSKKAHAPYECA